MTRLISLITSSRREYYWSLFYWPARYLLPHLESSAATEGLPLSPLVHLRQKARTDFTVRHIRYTGGCLGSGPCCGCSCSCSCGGVGEGEATALTWADISWLDSATDRGAGGRAVGRRAVGRCAVGRCAVGREYTDAEEILS